MKIFIRYIIGEVIFLVLRTWFGSLKQIASEQIQQQAILGFWHDSIFPVIAFLYRFDDPAKYVALVSSSKDGRRLAMILKRMGFGVVHGSSSARGFESLLELMNALRQDKSVLITPDGPRGPSRVLKTGILELGRLSGKSIMAVRAECPAAWRTGSWDKAQLPRPFSVVRVSLSDRFDIGATASASELENAGKRLERLLNGN